jgi:cell division protein FtsB
VGFLAMLKLLRHPLFLLVFTLASALFSFSLYRTVQKSSVSRQHVTQQEQELAQIAEENNRISQQLEYAQTPFAQEKIVRDELLMQKPGEQVIQIVEQKEYVPPPVQTVEVLTPWEEWREVLF